MFSAVNEFAASLIGIDEQIGWVVLSLGKYRACRLRITERLKININVLLFQQSSEAPVNI